MKIFYFLILIGISFSIDAANADEVGRSTVNGKTVIIDSNGTWKFAEVGPKVNEPQKCDGNILVSTKLKVSLCLSKSWTLSPSSGSAFEFQFADYKKDIFGGMIVEKTQASSKAMNEAILAATARRINKDPQSIPIRKKEIVKLNDREWQYFEYEVDYNGTMTMIANYHQAFNPSGVVQLMFWTSAAFFDESRPNIEAIASTLSTELEAAQ